MRISYPQFCAKGTAAFIAIFSFARRKSSSVFLRVSHSDLPHCRVCVAAERKLCADRVCVPSKAVFSCWYGKTPFMCGLSRAVSGLPCPSLFPEKGGKKQPDGLKTRPAGGADGLKMPSGSAFRASESGQKAFFGCIYTDAARSAVFFMMRSSKGRARVFFRRPMSEKKKNRPAMLITCPFFI